MSAVMKNIITNATISDHTLSLPTRRSHALIKMIAEILLANTVAVVEADIEAVAEEVTIEINIASKIKIPRAKNRTPNPLIEAWL